MYYELLTTSKSRFIVFTESDGLSKTYGQILFCKEEGFSAGIIKRHLNMNRKSKEFQSFITSSERFRELLFFVLNDQFVQILSKINHIKGRSTLKL